MQKALLSPQFFVVASAISAVQGYFLESHFYWLIAMFFFAAAIYNVLLLRHKILHIRSRLNNLACLTLGLILMAACGFGVHELSSYIQTGFNNPVIIVLGYTLLTIAAIFSLVTIAVGVFASSPIAYRFLERIFSPARENNIKLW